MNKWIERAISLGGYTSLDRNYLEHVLQGKTDSEILAWITPPPSVLNAYFAELYQKKGPKEAMDYLLEMSRAFDLFQKEPTFVETKPFIRLNLSGKAYGLALLDESGLGQVFPQMEAAVTPALLWEIATIFPNHLVGHVEGRIILRPQVTQDIRSEEALTSLTDRLILNDGSQKMVSYSQEDLLEQLMKQEVETLLWYGSKERQLTVVMEEKEWNYNF
ncbi:cystathionine beta-lyase [Streptococcus sp. NLN76]|uniref:cystathionine beta-lyase n=1 Tax=Streptococcus sp. NLN76 TaxID=2822800 RepID=UPI0018AA29C2|nr:cystathionine beta-lyase [Streptococcus sp. NLN76]MBF8969432.1 cystathionine beta-lyase [Streptococcus sp. NLN76]